VSVDLTDGERLELDLGRRPTLAERGVTPAPRAGQGADFDNARSQFPSVKHGVDEWVRFFDDRPEVMLQILGDIYRETKAEEARESGKAPTGRRPKSINGNLDELHRMTTPQYSVDSFEVAVKELIGTRSLRAFAAKVPMNHHTLTRMMRGEVKLEMWRLEQIADAGKVNPAFFREYREMQLLEVIGRYFSLRPNVSIALTKRIRADIQGGRR
jgi:hypothetical protein